MKNGAEPWARAGRAPGGAPAARGCPRGGPGRRGKRGFGGGSRPRRCRGRLRLLTFSASRSFTVGNGVRADILCGRRGRAGVSPAGLGCGLRGARGCRRGPRPGRARPQAAGRCNKRPRRAEGEEAAEEGEEDRCPRRRRGTRAAAREGSGRGRPPPRGGGAGGRRPGPARLPGPWLKVNVRLQSRPGERGPDSAPRPPQVSGAGRSSRSHARGGPSGGGGGGARRPVPARSARSPPRLSREERRARHAAPRGTRRRPAGGRAPAAGPLHSFPH